jgi:Leucine-rich repeat (LRR) protein
MKRLLCIAIFAVPLCGAAADFESWNRAVQKYQPIENKQSLNLNNNRITEIPNLNLPLLQSLGLSNNRIIEIPNLNLLQLRDLFLGNNQITEIPIGPHLPELTDLHLNGNQIEDITPEQLQQFPNLRDLYLDQNPITQEKVQALREAVAQTLPNLTIHADDVGPQYKFGYGKRGRQPTIPKQEEEK